MLNIKRLRFDREISQDQLSDLSGVQQSVISMLERNPSYDMRVSTLIALCNALRLTPNQMLEFEFKDSDR